MLKLIDLSFNMHPRANSPEQVMDAHKEGYGYAAFIKGRLDVMVIEHINFRGERVRDGVPYHFFKRKNKSWSLPFATYRFIKKEKPDVVLVQGLVFPLQTLFLGLFVPRHCKILLQHHGEQPVKGVRMFLQKIADRYVHGYLFTSEGNAQPWIAQQVVDHGNKCHEVLEASTFLKRQNKQDSRLKTGITGEQVFLWVGRLAADKDPLTVLDGFEQYLQVNSAARLYMIYQEDDILQQVRQRIESSPSLKNAVTLVGKVPHDQLQYWFSAADFFISGSHREGSGYALIEAMACGCIPVVTNIPSFKKIAGDHGYYFSPGNVSELHEALTKTKSLSREVLSDQIVSYFNETLSFQKIADDIFAICKELTIRTV